MGKAPKATPQEMGWGVVFDYLRAGDGGKILRIMVLEHHTKGRFLVLVESLNATAEVTSVGGCAGPYSMG